MSDTPISDSTPHNVAELGMLCRQLERELNAANDRIKQLETSVSYWNDRYNDLNHKVQNRDNY
jgi:hypothetical protein